MCLYSTIGNGRMYWKKRIDQLQLCIKKHDKHNLGGGYPCAKASACRASASCSAKKCGTSHTCLALANPAADMYVSVKNTQYKPCTRQHGKTRQDTENQKSRYTRQTQLVGGSACWLWYRVCVCACSRARVCVCVCVVQAHVWEQTAQDDVAERLEKVSPDCTSSNSYALVCSHGREALCDGSFTEGVGC